MRLYVYPFTIVKQRLSKNLTAAANTDATIEEFWGEQFYMQSVYIKGK
jgi:hypothetical protein